MKLNLNLEKNTKFIVSIIKIGFIGRYRILEQLRDVVFPQFIHIDFINNPDEFKKYDVIFVDKVFEKDLCKYLQRFIAINDDFKDLIIQLLKTVCSLTSCDELTIGIDLGYSKCGFVILTCDKPIIHITLPIDFVIELLKVLSLNFNNITLSIGYSSQILPLLNYFITNLPRDKEIDVVFVNEEDTKHKRKAIEEFKVLNKLNEDEIDALTYALTKSSGIKFILKR